jgi:hypothetical protein
VTPFEAQASARIATCVSEDELRRYMANAKGKSLAVHRAALERLITISVSGHDDPVARDCWAMVHTIEEIRRDAGKVWKMNRLRPKIERDGEVAALAYCATNRTDGFDEVIGYGLPQFTTEAIVLRHSNAFSQETLAKARARLEDAGVQVD